MKKNLILAAVASLALFSCSNDEYVGDATQSTNSQAIGFGVAKNAITRADATGDDAATKLYNQFNVYGAKNNGTNYTEVFSNYKAWYVSGSTSESNTKGWEYVGAAGQAYGTGTSFTDSLATGQAIKYWDYSASDYMFWAISPAKYELTANTTTGQVESFSLNDAEPNVAIRIAYPKKVVKADYSGKKSADDAVVTMKFITFQGQARVALYDAVPGYKINNVVFYTDDATKATDSKAYLYRKDSKKFSSKANYTFTFGNPTDSTTSYGTITTTIGNRTDANTYMDFGALNYTAYTADATTPCPAGDFLSETAAAPTYAGTASGNYYWNILPDDQLKELYLKVDFTLTSDDGKGEVINVKGATAVVPAAYTAWKANTAYTYVFKITKNTNGTTGDPTNPDDPEGLFPITFDAVVEDAVDYDSYEQGTISTLGTYSITTYQVGSVDGNNIKYVTGKDIDVTVMYVNKTSGTSTDVTNATATNANAKITVTGPVGSAFATAKDITPDKKFTPDEAGDYTITYTSAQENAGDAVATVTKIVTVQ